MTAGAVATAWAPGRVNLIGEHTDYSGGLVLPAATQLGVSVEVETRSESVSLTSTLAGPAEPFAPDGGGSAPGGWGRYAHAVAAELGELGRPPVGLTGTVSSTLPAGAGLSSSAALEVAIALALCTVADWQLDPLDLALACQRAELRAVGVPCGILDQAASILGREDHAVLLDCWTLEHRLVSLPADASLLVVGSGIERSLEATPYATRRAELERALGHVGAERSMAVTLADLDSVDGLDAIGTRRLRHVVTENDRVERFAAALERGELAAAGELMAASHASLRDDYEVSVPELDLLVALARSAGAFGARLLGAGFGGSVLVLVDRERADAVGREITTSYVSRTGRETSALVLRASAGASVRRGPADGS